MTRLQLLIFGIFWGMLSLVAQSQEMPSDCEARLDEAATAFSKGELEKALALIEPCITNHKHAFSKEDALAAQTMLATLYVELRNPIAARSRMKRILHAYPQYKPSVEADKIQLVELRNAFKVFPRLSIAIDGNRQFNDAKSLQSFQAGQGTTGVYGLLGIDSIQKNGYVNYTKGEARYLQNTDIQKTYRMRQTNSYSLSVIYAPTERLQLVAGVENTTVQFEVTPTRHYFQPYEITGSFAVNPTKNTQLHEWSYTLKQDLRFITPFVRLRYAFAPWQKGIRPYLEGGVQQMYLFSAERAYQRQIYASPLYPAAGTAHNNTDFQLEERQTTTPISLYKSMLWGYTGGVGIQWGHRALSYTAGARATYLPGNIISPTHRYDDMTGVLRYNHVEDDISLRYFAFHLGVCYTFHYGVVPIPVK